MSELDEERWAVMSERGCEATRIPYPEASELVRRLRGEGVRGLCVITGTAATHLPAAKVAVGNSSPPNNNKSKRLPRTKK
ncbi:MAG: hypothetical protein WCD76_02705 [Pyrinomonadaceae bacterium]